MGTVATDTTRFFAFGPLLDHDVAMLICGQSMIHSERRSAFLPGFEARYVNDFTVPVLVVAKSSVVHGEVVSIATDFVSSVIEPWQGAYELCTISVKLSDGGECQCLYFSHNGFREITSKRWELEEWQQKHKQEYLQMIGTRLH